jgi:ribokinase
MTGPQLAPELVVAGNLLVDDIVFHDGRTLMGEPGGGALYVSLAASLWKIRVGLVSVLGRDYPRGAMQTLSAKGVDLEGVRAYNGPSLRSWLLYEKLGRRIIHQLGTPPHAAVSPRPADFPRRYLDAPVVHICPSPFEQQRELVEGLARPGMALSLDPHLPVREDTLVRWRAVFARLAMFFISHEELLFHGSESNPQEALRRLATAGARAHVLYKRGESGGLHFDMQSGLVLPWESRTNVAIDTTGAGDAFAGGVLAGWLRREPLQRALERGVVSASFAIESWGPRSLIAASPANAEHRLAEWYGARA